MADIKITPENDNETNIRRGLDVIQSMIDISADRLEGLRTHCATSAELTQQEIRILETKLVKMFSELLITKAKLPERFPRGLPPTTGAELKQWLRVVGLSPESLNVVMQRVNTLENLLEKNDTELRTILNSNANIRDEEIRRLVRAMINLKKYRQSIIDCSNNKDIQQIDLYWDSWDRHHHTYYRTGASPRTNRSVITTRYNQQQHLNPIETNKTINNSNSSINDTSTENSILIINSTINILSPEDGSTSTITPSPSPPNSPIVLLQQQNNIRQQQTRTNRGFPTTPPPKKKHQTLITINNINNITQHQQPPQQQSNIVIDPILLTKSKSHESQLIIGTMITDDNNALTNSMISNDSTSAITTTSCNTNITTTATRTRLHTDPSGIGLEHHQYDNTMTNANNAATLEKLSSSNNLSVPRSPCTPIVTRSMGHMIAHRFTKKFKVISTCDLCQKQMFFGLKCKECKYRCHKDCESNVPPSCGLPQEFVDEFKTHLKTIQSDIYLSNTQTSPNMQHRNIIIGSGMGVGGGGAYLLTTNRQKQQHNIATYHGQDSSSAGSSCNSSSPSSPALLLTQQQQHLIQQQQQQHHFQLQHPQTTTTTTSAKLTQFNFPEIPIISSNLECNIVSSSAGGVTLETHPIIDNSSEKLIQSPHPILSILSSTSDINQSNDSDKTVSTGSTTSTSNDSERTPPIRLDSTEERDTINWPRQNSLSLKEWDIPYDDLHLLEKIGKGRFGTVHRALWHGDVAVKLLKEDYLDDDCTLEAFKLEVATFKKTRHENVVLFMGACMKPPRLAIVTSLCKGNTLYTHIHLRKDKFNLNRTTLVAQQISQGMGYLHARGIVHKDLKAKNIFLENGKVIITDFGLFSATKLCYCQYGLGIPQGWLCYLAPELIRGLTPYRPNDDDLPFSTASDVYAFGTVWYELLCGEFPFKTQSPPAIIWQVGRGMKQTLANLQASRDVKDILMLCWSFQADDRPDFAKLLTLLERLPKKRLARSPSHPVQLSRSAESVF